MKKEKKIYIQKSNIQGRGAFAKNPILKGEHVCFLKGKEVSIIQLKKRYESGEERKNLTDPLQIANNKYIILKDKYKYINHSCSPNMGVRGKNELRALKDIKRGEEITYDYSTTEWEDIKEWGNERKFYAEYWKMPCKCHTKVCRKIVKEFTFLSKRLKKKYLLQRALLNHILRMLKKTTAKI